MRALASQPQEPLPAPGLPPHGGPRRHAAALAVAAVLVVFFLPALCGGDFVYRDTGRMHAPTKRWVADELSHGRIPSWNPYAGIGVPVVPTAQDAVLHPFSALLTVLPPAAAMKAWILLSFALAAAGAFAWARALGAAPGGAAVAAMAFAVSGPLVSASDNVQFLTTYAALPWIFAATHRWVEDGEPLRLAGVGAAAALCAAAGDPQAWGFAVALVPAYAVAAAPGRRRAALGRGLVAAVAAAIASAPFVLPIIAWAPSSSRAGGVDAAAREVWNLHPRRLVELAIPDLFREDPGDHLSRVFAEFAPDPVNAVPWFLSVYVGVSVLLLALAGAVRSRQARLLVFTAAVFGWAALGHHAGFTWIAARVPVLDGFRYWEKVAVWIPLLLAPAAALGADALAAGMRPRAFAAAAGLAAGTLLAAAGVAALAPGVVVTWVGGPPDVAAAFVRGAASGAGRAGLVLAVLAAVAVLIRRGRLGGIAPAAVGVVVAFDLAGGNAGAYLLGPPERTTPPPLAVALPPGARVVAPFTARQDRWPELGRLGSTWEWSRRTLAASWNVPLRIGLSQDYVGLHDARWAHVVGAAIESGRFDRLGLFGFAYVVVPGAPELAARAGVAPPFRVVASDPELPAFLVELRHRARAYLAPGPFEAGAADALAFAERGGADGRTAVEGPVPAAADDPTGDVRVVRDDPGEVVLEAAADRSALLVLNDLFAPGWRAAVDGRPAEIVRVNAVARGVWIGAGRHEVRFGYRTPGLAAGWAVAGAGALALAAWALARRRARG